MPYKLRWEKQGVVFELSGVLTGAEMLATSREIARDPRRLRMAYQIVDFLNIERFEVNSEEVRRIAELDKKISEEVPDVKVACVTQHDLVRGLSRMYDLHGVESSWDVKVFTDLESARRWAGAPLN